MSNWTFAKLGELVNSYAGGTPSRNRLEYFGGSIPWIKSTEINQVTISRTEESLTEVGLKSSSAKWIPASSVLIALYGATAAQVAFLELEATANQAVLALVPSDRIDSLFLFHSLTASKSRLLFLAQGSGQPNLNKQTVDSLVVNLPPLLEQKQIAAILSTIDLAIAQTEALIAKQQRIKTGLMQDLLTKGIDKNGNIRSEETHEFKDSPLGRIPVEWEIEPCSAVCKEIVVGIVIRPSQYYKPSGVPVLRSANIRENATEFSEMVYMSEKDNKSLKKSCLFEGDLVTVRTGYPGTTAVIPSQLHGSNCVDVVISRPNSQRVRSNYLATWINSDFGKKQVLEGQGGLAQQHFNVGEVQKLLVKLPPLEEQARLDNLLWLKTKALMKYKHKLQKLHQLKTALMQDLLTGKVRVTELLKEREEIRP